MAIAGGHRDGLEGLFAVDGDDVAGGGVTAHRVSPLLLLFLVRSQSGGMAHAGRHVANAGVANGKVFERSFLGGPLAGEPKPAGRMALQSARGSAP
jgi:hypothetical protein